MTSSELVHIDGKHFFVDFATHILRLWSDVSTPILAQRLAWGPPAGVTAAAAGTTGCVSASVALRTRIRFCLKKKGRKIRVNVRGTKVQKYLKNVAQSAAIVQLIGNTLQQNMQCVSQEISQKIVKKSHISFLKPSFKPKPTLTTLSCVPCSFIVKKYL